MSEECTNCQRLKNHYVDGVNYAVCVFYKRYNITCTASKCPKYKPKKSEGE